MQRLILFFVILSSLACSICLASESLSDDVKLLVTKAESGDVEAQFRVGSAYDTGLGAPRNGSKAKKWYLLSANNGHAEAQNSIGSIFQAEKKYKEALPWYAKAAEQNHALAINNLAYLYDLGLGVKQDRQKGLELYTKAANLGWAEAMWNIANTYGSGVLGAEDLYSACIWSLRAKRYVEKNDQKLSNALKNITPYLEGQLGAQKFENCIKEAEAWVPH